MTSLAMDEMVIEVSGIPDSSSEKNIIDKLTIHFLRRSNCGGDVLVVIYPTSTRGQAYVVFESDEVPGVLEHTHVFELDGQFYPLAVNKVHHPKLDVEVNADLNISLFSNVRAIEKLLKSFGFKVSQNFPDQMSVKGSFLKLKLVYPKLMRCLSEQRSSKISHSVLRKSPDESESSAGFIERQSHIKSNSISSEDRPLSPDLTSRDQDSPNWKLQAGESISASSSLDYEGTSRRFQHRKSSSPKPTEVSRFVDPDVFAYVTCFKSNDVSRIMSNHSCRLSHVNQSETLEVKVQGENCEDAAEELSSFLQEMTVSLRTHKIDLKDLDESQKRQMTNKMLKLQKSFNVWIFEEKNVITLVGLSNDCYAARFYLEENAGMERQHFERSKPLRRSSSLPRQATSYNTGLRSSNDEVLQVAAFKGLTNSDVTVPRGRQPITSQLQAKSKNRTNHDSSAPSSGIHSTKQMTSPAMKKTLLPSKFQFDGKNNINQN